MAIQHRQASRHVEASNGHGNPGCSERTGDVEGPGILIGLDANKRDKSKPVVTSKAGKQRRDIHARVRLVDDFDVDGDIRA